MTGGHGGSALLILRPVFFEVSPLLRLSVSLVFCVGGTFFFQLRLRNTDSMVDLAEKEMQDAESNKRDLEVREAAPTMLCLFFVLLSW